MAVIITCDQCGAQIGSALDGWVLTHNDDGSHTLDVPIIIDAKSWADS